MSNNRKIQVDIYRLLKKTSEGLDFYEELFDKFENAANLTIKERLEGELKKEIKKLQRQREQIKAFIASPDVKDTKQLETFRKKIEAKMETFKVCEREVKTKTFSKEGLALAANDWAETPLTQTESWLKSAIEEGRKKMEIMEYEFQKQQGALAKSGRRAPNKGSPKSELHIRLEKLNVHIFKWESLLRMVSNEEVEPEEVDGLRENIEKVLEEDTDLACISNMAMYDDFDIPEPKLKLIIEDALEEKPEEEKKDAPLSSKSRSTQDLPTGSKNAGSASTTPRLGIAPSPLSNPVSGNNFEKEKEKEKGKKAVSSARPAVVSASKTPATTFFTTPAKGARVGSPPKEDGPDSLWMDELIDNVNDDTFGGEAMELTEPGTLAEMANATMKLMPPNDWGARKLELRKTHTPAEEAPVVHTQTTTTTTTTTTMNSNTNVNVNTNTNIATGEPSAEPPVAQEGPRSPTAAAAAPVASQQPSPIPQSTSLPPPMRGTKGQYTPSMTLSLLDMSLSNLPQTLDVERQRSYEPPNAIDPIPYFPQEVHPILSSREIYHHFDIETLFFIFYYHQKSYQQYFAAKELKAHSFRYHTELKRWYQRREKPKETTTKSERGAYIYFDYEDTWQNQTVDDFVFEYKHLEDELA